MKLVGGDSGRYEHEEFVEEVVLAPSERVVIDVLFDEPGQLILEHRTPDKTYTLATIDVSDEPASPSYADRFQTQRTAPELAAERERLAEYLEAEPDKTLAFVAEMDFEAPEALVYTCPMHPAVVSDEPGSCPECGMKLMPAATTYTCPMHPEVVSQEPGRCPECGMKLLPSQLVAAAAGSPEHSHEGHGEMHEHGDHGHGNAHEHGHHDHAAAGGIEWEDDMVDVNRLTTPANTRWKLVDRATGAENHQIGWQFRVGDREGAAGQRDGLRPSDAPPVPRPRRGPLPGPRARREAREQPVWKDTVLITTGETVDILLDVTNADAGWRTATSPSTTRAG